MTDNTNNNTLPLGVWQPIKTAPRQDALSFLVLRTSQNGFTYTMQVVRFGEEMYPEHLDVNVDFYDRVLDATHWMPLPAAPSSVAAAPQPQAVQVSAIGRWTHPSDILRRAHDHMHKLLSLIPGNDRAYTDTTNMMAELRDIIATPDEASFEASYEKVLAKFWNKQPI